MSRRPALWATSVIASAAIALSACGGDESTASSTAPEPGGAIPGGADPEQMQALQDCLDEQGVQLPSPDGSGGAPSIDAKAQKALQSCSQYLPDGAPPSGTPPSSP